MTDIVARMFTEGGKHSKGRAPQNGKDSRHDIMAGFWADKPGTMEGMMLDSNAAEISQDESPEICSYLPSLNGKHVLELGAGIGRFTHCLTAMAKSVHVVDFIQGFVDKNRQHNGHKGNVTFECNDAMKVVPPGGDGSVDVVFTNWLMMYLSDEEVQTLAKKALSWLKPGGYFFVRESCFHASGNMPRNSGNPTHYRDPSKYCELFQVISNESGPLFEGGDEFELQFATSVKTYIMHKQNPNQICWLYRKVNRSAPPLQRTQTLQEFLDGNQYTQRSILKYEKIYGRNFVSVGGRKVASQFIQKFDLQPKEYVLDVGAGIGGAAFLMVQDYDTHVLAMDLSSNMVTIGMQRRVQEDNSKAEGPSRLLHQLSFEISDINKRDYPPDVFDCIHSRETLLHLKDKASILQKFHKWLRPGGRLLITDYCRGEKAEDNYSRQFRKYIQDRGYYPASISEYKSMLELAGFEVVSAKNSNEMFTDILDEEMDALERSEKSFVNEFSQYEYDQAVQNWTSKKKFCKDEDLVWGYYFAQKPGEKKLQPWETKPKSK